MTDAVFLPGEDTLLGSWSALAQLSPGARLINSGASVAAVFPSWAPLNNAILRTGPGDPVAAAVLDQLGATYTGAGVAEWAAWVPSPVSDLDSPDAGLALNGLQRDTTTLVMVAELRAGLPLHDAVIQTSIASATLAGDEAMPAKDLEPPDGVPGLQGCVIIRDGFAVASAWTFLRERDCGIYAVGTVPGWRRRGLARALMLHVLADAWRKGARTASLQSTRAGQPLYAALGFRPVGRYEEWVASSASNE